MDQKSTWSGLLCLQILFAQFRRSVNFSAIVPQSVREEYLKNPSETLLKLANDQKLRAEKVTSTEIFQSYHGPALFRCRDNTWLLLTNTLQWKMAEIQVFDPARAKGNTPEPRTQEMLEKEFGGEILIFRNLTMVDHTKQTRLYCLSAIAQHHNTQMDLRRVMYEYAVGDGEVRENLFRQIASDYSFKTRKLKLKWKKLLASSSVMPAIAIKKSGTYLVLCGLRKNGEELELVVVDPTEDLTPGKQFRFWNREKYEQECTGECILLKKTYSLADENQPFSLRWFIPEFLKLKGVFGQIALMVALLTIFSLIIPLFFQIVVDKVLVNRTYYTLNVLGIGILIAILFNTLVEYVRSYLLLFATNKIDISTATKTFQHLMRLPVDFFERVPSGVLLKHMQQTERIRGFLSGNLFFTVLDLAALCIFIPFLLCYSVQLTLVVLAFSALMALVIASLIKPFQHRLDELYQAEGRRQSMLVEAIHGIRTVKSLALEPVEKRIWDDSTAYAIKSYFRVGKISMTARSLSQMLEMMMTVCVIWYGAYLVFNYSISIGALIAFQMLAGRVTGPLVKMVGLIHEYQQIALSVRMLGVVMNTPPEPRGGGVRNPLRGEIAFENVTFQYRQDLPQVIKHFNAHIPQGATIGFVGRSGSGKTTLTKLLQGLYPVTTGLVKIDGIDIREIDKSHLRSSIGVVLQENYFFSGTVRENIALTKQNASLEEILYAARLAGADEFIQRLPRGYDTVLEENASNLSGGQKQRLAIARALLTNPPVLIFDEATSALDPESEAVIQRNLKAIASGRTVLIVSHRLSIVSHADQILVLNNGELSDSGTHQELLSRDGIYKEFWCQQMGEVK